MARPPERGAHRLRVGEGEIALAAGRRHAPADALQRTLDYLRRIAEAENEHMRHARVLAALAQAGRPDNSTWISSHLPPTPEGNPEMADAAPEPKDPPLIRREDYTPFPWLVPEVSLDFALGLDKTRVQVGSDRAAQRPRPNRSDVLRLNGDGLTVAEVLVDGEAVNNWSMDGGDLMVPLRERFAPRRGHHRDRSVGQQPADGALCLERHALHPVRGRGLSPHHLLPRPARRALDLHRADGRARRKHFPVLLSNGNRTAARRGRRRHALGRMARSLAQAVLPLRAGRGQSGRQHATPSRP